MKQWNNDSRICISPTAIPISPKEMEISARINTYKELQRNGHYYRTCSPTEHNEMFFLKAMHITGSTAITQYVSGYSSGRYMKLSSSERLEEWMDFSSFGDKFVVGLGFDCEGCVIGGIEVGKL